MADSGVKSVKNDAVSARAKQRKDDPPIDSKELPKASKAKLKKEDQNPEKQMANLANHERRIGYLFADPALTTRPVVIKTPPRYIGQHLYEKICRLDDALKLTELRQEGTHIDLLLQRAQEGGTS